MSEATHSTPVKSKWELQQYGKTLSEKDKVKAEEDRFMGQFHSQSDGKDTVTH